VTDATPWICPKCGAGIAPWIREHCTPIEPEQSPPLADAEITRDHMGAVTQVAPTPIRERRSPGAVRLGFQGQVIAANTRGRE